MSCGVAGMARLSGRWHPGPAGRSEVRGVAMEADREPPAMAARVDVVIGTSSVAMEADRERPAMDSI
jgi:hypothetical protein